MSGGAPGGPDVLLRQFRVFVCNFTPREPSSERNWPKRRQPVGSTLSYRTLLGLLWPHTRYRQDSAHTTLTRIGLTLEFRSNIDRAHTRNGHQRDRPPTLLYGNYGTNTCYLSSTQHRQTDSLFWFFFLSSLLWSCSFATQLQPAEMRAVGRRRTMWELSKRRDSCAADLTRGSYASRARRKRGFVYILIIDFRARSLLPLDIEEGRKLKSGWVDAVATSGDTTREPTKSRHPTLCCWPLRKRTTTKKDHN